MSSKYYCQSYYRKSEHVEVEDIDFKYCEKPRCNNCRRVIVACIGQTCWNCTLCKGGCGTRRGNTEFKKSRCPDCYSQYITTKPKCQTCSEIIPKRNIFGTSTQFCYKCVPCVGGCGTKGHQSVRSDWGNMCSTCYHKCLGCGEEAFNIDRICNKCRPCADCGKKGIYLEQFCKTCWRARQSKCIGCNKPLFRVKGDESNECNKCKRKCKICGEKWTVSSNSKTKICECCTTSCNSCNKTDTKKHNRKEECENCWSTRQPKCLRCSEIVSAEGKVCAWCYGKCINCGGSKGCYDGKLVCTNCSPVVQN